MAAPINGAFSQSPYPAGAPAAPQAFDPMAGQFGPPQTPGPTMFGCGPATDTVRFGDGEEAPAPDAPADDAPAGDGFVTRLVDRLKSHFSPAGKNPVKLLFKLITFPFKLPFMLLGAARNKAGGEEASE